MEDAAVVWGDIVGVEEDSLLNWDPHLCQFSKVSFDCNRVSLYARLLKLVTGVEISTLPVNRSGSDGKAVNRSRRTAIAEPKSTAFRRSMAML